MQLRNQPHSNFNWLDNLSDSTREGIRLRALEPELFWVDGVLPCTHRVLESGKYVCKATP